MAKIKAPRRQSPSPSKQQKSTQHRKKKRVRRAKQVEERPPIKLRKATLLTREVIEKVHDCLSRGNYTQTAAALAGVTHQTMVDWIRRGVIERRRMAEAGEVEPEEKEAIYAELSLAVDQALAESEDRDLTVIMHAAPRNWTAAAWRLERRHPGRWGRIDRTQVIDDDSAKERVALKLSLIDDRPAEDEDENDEADNV